MRLHNRYIFDTVIKKFFIVLFLLISIIWFSKTISFVKYITENGIEASKFLNLFILILPSFLLYLIPISLFIAVTISINKFINNNEIAILRNSYLSDFKISLPVIKISFYMMFFSLIISIFLAPYANKKLSVERNNLKNNYSNISFNDAVFENLKDITIYINKKDQDSKFYGIILNDSRNKEINLTITSQTGYLILEENSLVLSMQNGTIQRFNKANNEVNILNFEEYAFNLSEEEKVDYSRKWRVKEMNIFELLSPALYSSDDNRAIFIAEINKRVIIAIINIVLTIIPIAILMTNEFSRRGNLRSILASIFVAIATLIAIIAMIKSSQDNNFLIYINYSLIAAVIFIAIIAIKRSKIVKL